MTGEQAGGLFLFFIFKVVMDAIISKSKERFTEKGVTYLTTVPEMVRVHKRSNPEDEFAVKRRKFGRKKTSRLLPSGASMGLYLPQGSRYHSRWWCCDRFKCVATCSRKSVVSLGVGRNLRCDEPRALPWGYSVASVDRERIYTSH